MLIYTIKFSQPRMHRTPYYDPPPPPMCTYLLDAPYSNRFPNTGARWAVRKTD